MCADRKVFPHPHLNAQLFMNLTTQTRFRGLARINFATRKLSFEWHTHGGTTLGSKNEPIPLDYGACDMNMPGFVQSGLKIRLNLAQSPQALITPISPAIKSRSPPSTTARCIWFDEIIEFRITVVFCKVPLFDIEKAHIFKYINVKGVPILT
jgi:hypothetical protein